MSFYYQFRPIEQWPGKRTLSPSPSSFKASFTKTLDLLERELSFLNARNIVIQADCDPSEIRLDGMLRANARLRSNGIILSFDSKFGPLSYPADKFRSWEDNLRAIALCLEALRKVDRYGVTKHGEQYKGWDQLPPPDDKAIILKYAPAFAHDLKSAAREAQRKTHPDLGGNAAEFNAVRQAIERLGL